ncbi:MAG: hypothetical protein ACYCOU_12185 [Sulfobacillus sp.]
MTTGIQFQFGRKSRIIKLVAVSDLTSGIDCPIPNACGIPLAVIRTAAKGGYDRAALDNQLATYLMAEVDSGFAADEWQQGLGEVIIFRRDGKSLTKDHLISLWEFMSSLMFYNVGDTQYDNWDSMIADGCISPETFHEFMSKLEYDDLW